MKNFFSFFLFFFLFINTSFGSGKDLTVYKFGKEPRLDVTSKKAFNYPTSNMPKGLLNVRIKQYRKETKKIVERNRTLQKKYINHVFFRIFLINPRKHTFKDLNICIQYFVTRASSSKIGTLEEEEAYKKVYKLESLPSLQKLVVDVPAELFTHYKVYRGSKVLGGREFTGGIISIFYKGKLIYQKTNNRNLRKLGIKEL